jgi:hypothetical protein
LRLYCEPGPREPALGSTLLYRVGERPQCPADGLVFDVGVITQAAATFQVVILPMGTVVGLLVGPSGLDVGQESLVGTSCGDGLENSLDVSFSPAQLEGRTNEHANKVAYPINISSDIGFKPFDVDSDSFHVAPWWSLDACTF